jgi:RNA polymerase sigma-70 factor (ECF subfamily)
MTEPVPDLDDRALVAKYLASRSEAAFLSLYDRHTDDLYRFAARLTWKSGHDPGELVQEAWLRALGALPGFRWGSSLRTWLCGIVLNRWRELQRGAERDRRLAVIEGHRPAPPSASREESIALERALARLAPGHREVLLLHDLEGYTHEEIARHFGIVEGTSKSQLHRARRALREALQEMEGSGDEQRPKVRS